VKVAERLTVFELAQTVCKGLIDLVTVGVKLSLTVSERGLQIPTPVVVAIRSTNPAAMLAAVGLYQIEKAFGPLLGKATPAAVLQLAPVARVAVAEKRTLSTSLQTVTSKPAESVGAGLM
jgi:hypothetical protein